MKMKTITNSNLELLMIWIHWNIRIFHIDQNTELFKINKKNLLINNSQEINFIKILKNIHFKVTNTNQFKIKINKVISFLKITILIIFNLIIRISQ
jgi:hypothetical protein